MHTTSLPRQAADLLEISTPSFGGLPVLTGFDGFVDTILHVVEKRLSAVDYTRMAQTKTFGQKIVAAAGLSANFEFVTQMQKLGGNGPIMANALSAVGFPVTYIGTLGEGALHPVFAEFGSKVRAISLCDPGFTDAIEFEDGKLMCGKHESLGKVTWETLVSKLPVSEFEELLRESRLAAFVNWTMLPNMTGLLQKILEHLPQVDGGKTRWAFFDLCDPAKRTAEDLGEALATIAKFEKSYRVILGLNFNEGCQVGEVLGLPCPEQTHASVSHHADAIRRVLSVDTVVIHPTRFAGGADAAGTFAVEGPFTPTPKITTGAGDHFNAGFLVGRMLGADLATSLQIGVAMSGFYVREARSPSSDDLAVFLRTLEE